MPREYRLFLGDMHECATKVKRYTKGLTFEDFLRDELVRDATHRNLEIIGAAARAPPGEIRARHPEVDWRGIIGLRNILAHLYFGLEPETIWHVIEVRFPELLGQLAEILEREQ